MDIYDELGVRKVINGSATLTMLGGSLMPPEVLAAMAEAVMVGAAVARRRNRPVTRSMTRIRVSPSEGDTATWVVRKRSWAVHRTTPKASVTTPTCSLVASTCCMSSAIASGLSFPSTARTA